MESNQAPFTEMFYYAGKEKNIKIALWLYNTVSKNELLSPLPIEIWQHIITFVPRDPYMFTHKFALRKWLYKNEDGSIPVHPGKLLQQA
jgi:hypothetical protein